MITLFHPRFALLAAAVLAGGTPVHAGAQSAVMVETRAEADGTSTLVHEVLVDAPAMDVWTAVATPEGWMTWAVPAARWVDGAPDVLETSYDPAEKPGGPGTIQQRFLAQIPGRLLAFRTIKAPAGFPNWESYRLVTSVFELEPAGQRTRVRLTSTGYPDSEAGRELVAFFRQGNAETLEQLSARFAPE